MTVKKEPNRFYLDDDQGRTVAEITIVAGEQNTLIIDHTFVDESLRGQGIAARLVEVVVTDAREQNKTIVPACPFAEKEFESHPDYRDVLAT